MTANEHGASRQVTPQAAVVVTGGPGTGKSVVVQALSNLLTDAGVEHGAIETEQLGWGHPWLAFRDTLPALQELLEIQRRAGRRLFLLTATTETDADLDALVRATGADTVLVAALRVKPATASARVLRREPKQWAGRDALAHHAGRLALSIPALRRVDLVIDTDTTEPLAVAAVIHDRMTGVGLLNVPSPTRQMSSPKRTGP